MTFFLKFASAFVLMAFFSISSVYAGQLPISHTFTAIEAPSGASTNNPVTPVLNENVVPAVAIVSGVAHTCALTAAGGVKCWGRNDKGQLGDGTTENRNQPVDVVGLPDQIVAIAAAGYNTCALTAGGAVKCWGDNGFYQLGLPSITLPYSATPRDIDNLSSGVVAIDGGIGGHLCALTSNGQVKCWGDNTYGQVGIWAFDGGEYPPYTVNLGGLSAKTVRTGMNHSCVLTSDDGVKCWGRNNYGQLGNGNTTDTHFAQNVSGLISNVRVLGRSYNHTCAILNNSEVRCWGRNDGGQLGDGTTQYRSQPVAVAGLSSPVRQIAAGSDFTCVITESGGVQCWGKNDYGQLGNGNNQSQTIPTDVAFLQRNVQAISTGVFFACALITDGSIRCWGFNVEGSLGNGNNEDQSTPVNVIGFGTPLSYTYLPLLTR